MKKSVLLKNLRKKAVTDQKNGRTGRKKSQMEESIR